MFGYTPGQQFPSAAPESFEGPLVGLEGQVQQVLYGAQPNPPRQCSVAESMATGAAVGFGAWMVWQGMKRRKQRVGEWTTPVFRSQVLWWALFILVIFLQAVWKSWWVLGGGFVLASVLATVYLAHASRKAARRGGRRP